MRKLKLYASFVVLLAYPFFSPASHSSDDSFDDSDSAPLASLKDFVSAYGSKKIRGFVWADLYDSHTFNKNKLQEEYQEVRDAAKVVSFSAGNPVFEEGQYTPGEQWHFLKFSNNQNAPTQGYFWIAEQKPEVSCEISITEGLSIEHEPLKITIKKVSGSKEGKGKLSNIPMTLTYNSNNDSQSKRSSYFKQSVAIKKVLPTNLTFALPDTLIRETGTYKIPFEVPITISGSVVFYLKTQEQNFRSATIADIYRSLQKTDPDNDLLIGYSLVENSLVFKVKGTLTRNIVSFRNSSLQTQTK